MSRKVSYDGYLIDPSSGRKTGVRANDEQLRAAGMAPKKEPAAPAELKRPTMPGYENIRGADGLLKEQFQVKAGPEIQLNTQAIERLREQALANESPWLKQQLEQNAAQGMRAQNMAARQAATAAAAGQAALARRGGLSSGSAERMAMNAENQRMLAQQDASAQADANRLNLMVGDAQAQRALLQSMPGMELAQGQFGQNERAYQTGVQQFNLGNVLQDISNKRQFDLGKFAEEMKGFGAEKSAQAVEKGGK